MARKKISEYRAKKILTSSLGLSYNGFSYDAASGKFSLEKSVDVNKRFVVKVDQGVKKRYKSGLVLLDVRVPDLATAIKNLENKGYSKFLIEEYIRHDISAERYISLERVREGIQILYSPKGGISIEEHSASIERFLYTNADDIEKLRHIAIPSKMLEGIIQTFNSNYFSFLELNPILVLLDSVILLDTACEVDSTAEFFVERSWTNADFVEQKIVEKTVENLAARSQAAFNLTVLNPNGSIFMLLSGGGASIVLADEVVNQGFGHELANYGEYSGNPNEEETYIYTKNVLSLLLKSKSKQKVLLIGGGVANFTDIRITFRGVIKALHEEAENLRKSNVKVFVRRGGPNQSEGLASMSEFLKREGLYGLVNGPDMNLTDIVKEALVYV